MIAYPIDIIKGRFVSDALNNGPGERKYKGLLDCAIKSIRNDGIEGLYKGFEINLYPTLMYRTLYFGLFNTGRAYLFPDMKEANAGSVLIFAYLVTYCSLHAAYPLDQVK